MDGNDLRPSHHCSPEGLRRGERQWLMYCSNGEGGGGQWEGGWEWSQMSQHCSPEG